MRIRFTVERRGKTPTQAADGAVDRIEKVVAETAHDFEDAAKLRCPVSGTVKRGPDQPHGVRLEAQEKVPGRLRASIISRSWRRGRRYFGSCGFTAEHGIYVELGTSGPSAVIRPVKKKALAWYGPGRAIITRRSSRGGPIKVGTPKRPRTMWGALRERGGRRQSMPFLRPAWYVDTLPTARKRLRDALNKP